MASIPQCGVGYYAGTPNSYNLTYPLECLSCDSSFIKITHECYNIACNTFTTAIEGTIGYKSCFDDMNATYFLIVLYAIAGFFLGIMMIVSLCAEEIQTGKRVDKIYFVQLFSFMSLFFLMSLSVSFNGLIGGVDSNYYPTYDSGVQIYRTILITLSTLSCLGTVIFLVRSIYSRNRSSFTQNCVMTAIKSHILLACEVIMIHVYVNLYTLLTGVVGIPQYDNYGNLTNGNAHIQQVTNYNAMVCFIIGLLFVALVINVVYLISLVYKHCKAEGVNPNEAVLIGNDLNC
jgi:hypothetical protein